MPSIQELVVLMLIIAVLSMTGIWPSISRALRELRGDVVPPEEPSKADMDVSYRMMGVSPSASWDQIEQAYRKKAKLHHPDHGGDEDTMRALNEAYRLLKDLRKR